MAAPRSWAVTSQAHDQVINTDAGETITGSYVYFRTGAGNSASVFVRDNLFTVDNVKAQINERARLIDEVGELSVGQG